jgi:heptosyltransferase-1
MPRETSLPEAPRILIVRLSALGDVIHGIPVACALREAFPEAFIAWVVEGRSAELLDGHPALDEVIRLPRKWYKSPREVFALRRRLRELQFDVTIDLQCLTKSAAAAWFTGAPRRIGKAGHDGREFSKLFHNELIHARGQHVIDHYLELLQPLGIFKPRVRFNLPEHFDDASMAERTLRTLHLPHKGFAVLNPGAGWPSKIWPPDRYGEIARQLRDSHGLASLAVWGIPSELPLAEAIVRVSDGAAQLAPATTVPQLAAVCRRAALFLGSDTGPMHLAVAVGTPTISLHGPSQADWCGAYGPSNVRLQAYYEDGSARERRTADDAAMRAISREMAYHACADVLDRIVQRQAS